MFKKQIGVNYWQEIKNIVRIVIISIQFFKTNADVYIDLNITLFKYEQNNVGCMGGYS